MANDKKQRVVATIYGQQYTLLGEESEEHLLCLAALVDNKMLEIRKGNPQLNQSKVAVLAALQMADDLVKLNHQYEKLLKDLDTVTANPKKSNKKQTKEK